MNAPVFAARPLEPVDVSSGRELASALGPHGVYVGNFLSGGATVGDGGEVVGLYGVDGLLGMVFFGARGNLILLEREPLDACAVATVVDDSIRAWRIALGPAAVVAELASRQRRPPLVDRSQLYYGVGTDRVDAGAIDAEVRPAERRDLAMLTEAALDLNRSDLHVDPRDVHRGWLRETLRRRIRKEQTLVLGPIGAPQCKLDLGSGGPHGLMVEGVYTVPTARGRGLASRLVATVIARAAADYSLVCLHVAAENAAARRAYERAGMRAMGECRLLLR